MNMNCKIYLLLLVQLLVFVKVNSKEFIVLQSTTSARDSGLYDYILPFLTRNMV